MSTPAGSTEPVRPLTVDGTGCEPCAWYAAGQVNSGESLWWTHTREVLVITTLVVGDAVDKRHAG